MIKVNLLEGTAEQRVSIQKTKTVAKHGQQIFMLIAALAVALLAIGADHLWTTSAHSKAKEEFDREQEQAKQLEADLARKTQLENELKQIEERIKTIKQLRAEQKGPVAMLSAINERMPGGTADFKLQSITQSGSRLKVIGISTNQQVVANFAQQLEFSNGLFTNVIPTVEGNEVKVEEPNKDKNADGEAMVRQFKFTIDCDYNKPRADGDKPADKPAEKK
jgi:Tfp pilus assembly protein PilN